jgi:hypothetical protein
VPWPRESARQVAFVVLRRVEIVERPGDEQIRIGVEIFGKLVALIAQVRLDLEVHIEMELDRAGAKRAPEFLHHRVI